MRMLNKIIFTWILGLFTVTFLGSFAFSQIPNGALGAIDYGKPFNYLLSLAQWDGGNYLNIAQNGYQTLGSYAFAPLYPFLIKLASTFTRSYLFAGLIISISSFTLFLNIFYRYIKNRCGKSLAQTTVITFLLFPTTFF
jgi:hypothetical protein